MQIKVHGFEMGYDDSGGNGMPLLLIHGFPLDRTLWASQVKGLADAARVIAPDLRGFGESAMPSGAVTMDTYAEDLRGLLDALGVKNAVVAGLSMGGYVAFAFYRQFPHRVRALILANTRAPADSPEGKKARDTNAALAREKGVGTIADNMLPKMLTPQTHESRLEVAKNVREMMARQSVEGVAAALAAMRDRPDSTPTLAEISVPTLVITGSDDTLIPPKDSEAIRAAIKDARFVSLPNAAHLSNVEQPEAFNQAVHEFLKTIA